MTATSNLEIVVAMERAELIPLHLIRSKLSQVVILHFKILKMKTTSFKALSHFKVNLKLSKTGYMMRYLPFRASFTGKTLNSTILLKGRMWARS
jgi:hypothetical protein